MSRETLPWSNDGATSWRPLAALRRRWALTVVAGAVTLAAGATLVWSLPDLYRTSATIMVEQLVSESFVPSTANRELETRLHVIQQEVLSRTRLQELIERFNLYPELRRRASSESVLDQARRDIRLDLLGPERLNGATKTIAFQLSYISPDPNTVAEVTNALASFYVSQNNLIRAEEALQTTEVLKGQLAQIEGELRQQEQQVEAFTRQHVGELPQQVQLNLSTLDRLNAQLRINGDRQIRAMDQRQKLIDTAEWAEVTRQMGEMRTPKDDRLDQMRRDLQQLEAQFMPRHPDVIRLRAELQTLQRELSEQGATVQPPGAAPGSTAQPPEAAAASAAIPTPEMRRSMLEQLDAELATLKSEESTLRGRIADVESRLVGVPQRQQELTRVTRDYETTQAQYASLLKRLDEAQLARDMEQGQQGERFRILEAAAVPRDPAVPDRQRLLILVLLLSAVAAIGFVVAIDRFDTSFHAVDDVREFTSVPVLAVIPRIERRRSRVYARMALATASALVMIAIASALAHYMGSGNEQLVRMLVRTG